MISRSFRSFRLVCGPGEVPLVEALLQAQGFVFDNEPFHPLARRLLDGPLPLGSSLAAVFGYIYIQDRSSMLPPLALAPAAGEAVLDMCASPGSKTGLLAGLVGKTGFVLGNEPSAKRLATLRRNLAQQNLINSGTCSWPGEHLPLPDANAACPGWSRIQLDPPCSGWGTVEKHPQALRLWQGDKLKPLISLQRRLLAEAARLLRPGGRLAYSTCTTNPAENEEQVRYARDTLGLEPVPLPDVPGFSFAAPAREDCSGVWRVDTGPDGQGFFVALLQKARSSGPLPEKGPHREDRDLLARNSLDSPGFDSALLPPGELALFKDNILFLPAPASHVLPRGFGWKGFPLGKMDKSGKARTDPYLRLFMPRAESAAQQGLPCLNLDDPAPALALLSGQSLIVDAPGQELGLYYRNLPLCRLSIKGKRAILPPRRS